MNDGLTHIRYLSDTTAICEDPSRLDTFSSPVIREMRKYGTIPCRECSALLLAHNKREFEKEMERGDYRIQYVSEPKPAFNKVALISGVAIGLVFWLVIFLVVLAVWFR